MNGAQVSGFLTQASPFTDPHRNEFVLTSDVLGLSSLVDLLNSSLELRREASWARFTRKCRQWPTVGSDLIKDNDGDPVLLRGRVLDLGRATDSLGHARFLADGCERPLSCAGSSISTRTTCAAGCARISTASMRSK